MKRLFLALLIIFLSAVTVSADPRIDILDNYCEFITEADTSSQITLAGCDAKVAAVMQTDQSDVVNGYVYIKQRIRTEEADAIFGDQRVYRFAGYEKEGYVKSSWRCRIVDSWGQTYITTQWESEAKMIKEKGTWGTVVYRLSCRGAGAR